MSTITRTETSHGVKIESEDAEGNISLIQDFTNFPLWQSLLGLFILGIFICGFLWLFTL